LSAEAADEVGPFGCSAFGDDNDNDRAQDARAT
jgi:hypothetical protein